MNKEIELLHKKIQAQDKIINEQVLEIARLKGKSEILEENNKLLLQQKQQMYEDLDIAYDKIDKAIEILNKLNIKLKDILQIGIDIKEINVIKQILGEKENENNNI